MVIESREVSASHVGLKGLVYVSCSAPNKLISVCAWHAGLYILIRALCFSSVLNILQWLGFIRQPHCSDVIVTVGMVFLRAALLRSRFNSYKRGWADKSSGCHWFAMKAPGRTMTMVLNHGHILSLTIQSPGYNQAYNNHYPRNRSQFPGTTYLSRLSLVCLRTTSPIKSSL